MDDTVGLHSAMIWDGAIQLYMECQTIISQEMGAQLPIFSLSNCCILVYLVYKMQPFEL